MAGTGIQSVLDISRGSLANSSQQIRLISNNVANVDTEGYSRRRAELVATEGTTLEGSSSFGYGATIEVVNRVTDRFLNDELMNRVSDRAYSEVRDDLLGRIQSFFSLSGETATIGEEMEGFFGALADLEESPSDTALRSNVLIAGENLTDTIRSTFQGVADLQREIDDRLEFMVNDVNNKLSELANVNLRISALEVDQQQSLTLRDRQDLLLKDLSEYFSFNLTRNDDGTVGVSLDNGFALVQGATARFLDFKEDPTFAPAGGFPNGLDGLPLRHIVHDFNADLTTPSDLDLTQAFSRAGGQLGGLLSLRGVQSTSDVSAFDSQGDLVEVATRIEVIARDLLHRFNNVYLGNQATSGNPNAEADPGNSPAVDALGNPAPAFGLFQSKPTLAIKDADAFGEVDDFYDAGGNDTEVYARNIMMAITDPAKLAAGIDQDPGAGTSVASGDSRNIAHLIEARDLSNSYSFGSFNATLGIDDVYDDMVIKVGSLKSRAASDLSLNRDREQQAEELQQSISGVSLDEEFAKLITAQRSFEAAARMVRVGDELFQQVLGLLG